MPCQSEGNRVGTQGKFCASVSLCKGASQGRGDPWLLFLLLFQLSAVQAGGSTAFIYANFSVPVVKVRGHVEFLGAGKGGRCSLYLSSCRELWPSLSRCQTPAWSSLIPKIQSWVSQLCFRVPNPSLLRRMRLFSGGTCGGMGMVMGTPSTLAAPSWPGTSGVSDSTRCHPGVGGTAPPAGRQEGLGMHKYPE